MMVGLCGVATVVTAPYPGGDAEYAADAAEAPATRITIAVSRVSTDLIFALLIS